MGRCVVMLLVIILSPVVLTGLPGRFSQMGLLHQSSVRLLRGLTFIYFAVSVIMLTWYNIKWYLYEMGLLTNFSVSKKVTNGNTNQVGLLLLYEF